MINVKFDVGHLKDIILRKWDTCFLLVSYIFRYDGTNSAFFFTFKNKKHFIGVCRGNSNPKVIRIHVFVFEYLFLFFLTCSFKKNNFMNFIERFFLNQRRKLCRKIKIFLQISKADYTINISQRAKSFLWEFLLHLSVDHFGDFISKSRFNIVTFFIQMLSFKN